MSEKFEGMDMEGFPEMEEKEVREADPETVAIEEILDFLAKNFEYSFSVAEAIEKFLAQPAKNVLMPIDKGNLKRLMGILEDQGILSSDGEKSGHYHLRTTGV